MKACPTTVRSRRRKYSWGDWEMEVIGLWSIVFSQYRTLHIITFNSENSSDSSDSEPFFVAASWHWSRYDAVDVVVAVENRFICRKCRHSRRDI